MQNQDDIKEKVIDILLRRNIVTFSFDPPYVYITGLKSPIYFDNRILISYPKDLKFIISEMVNLIKSKPELCNVDYISSSLNYAAPFGILIAEALDLPLVLIREEQRSHGKKNKIEGILGMLCHMVLSSFTFLLILEVSISSKTSFNWLPKKIEIIAGGASFAPKR